jgi:hypothetical protein
VNTRAAMCTSLWIRRATWSATSPTPKCAFCSTRTPDSVDIDSVITIISVEITSAMIMTSGMVMPLLRPQVGARMVTSRMVISRMVISLGPRRG